MRRAGAARAGASTMVYHGKSRPELARGRECGAPLRPTPRRASQLMGSSTHPLSQRDVHFTAELGAEAMRLACATQIEPADGAEREDWAQSQSIRELFKRRAIHKLFQGAISQSFHTRGIPKAVQLHAS